MNYFSKRVKPPYFKAGLLSFLMLLLCGAQPAGAALISASASIDWSTFKITAIDVGNGLPTLKWNSQNDNSQASIGYYSSTYENASNWSAGTSATESGSTSTFNKSASASTSVNQIKADASVSGSLVNQYSSPYSTTYRSGNFTVEGDGLLLFQANYSLAGDIGTAASGTASSNVNFNLNAFSNGGNGNGSASQTFNHYIYNGSFAENGILATALVFKDGWSGSFSASANASVTSYGVSSVPLPAAFWLFGSALAGVGALRRSNIGRLAT
ncbi:MAG: VPLPA-CTERM sorting domain-containing protein [Methylobacter sp.]|nr:VPLPA-CTERM sorting domain-containing protein [Methylobacter sp.]